MYYRGLEIGTICYSSENLHKDFKTWDFKNQTVLDCGINYKMSIALTVVKVAFFTFPCILHSFV